MTECIVVAFCIGGAAFLLVPFLLNARGKARSATCQYHEMKLIMATLEFNEQAASLEPSKWPKQLAHDFVDPQIVYFCPSDERRFRHEASYGMNNRTFQFALDDADKGVFLDYNAIVAAVIGSESAANWKTFIAPRHFEFVNVAFYDGRVELRDPFMLDPAECEHVFRFWLPVVDRPLVSEDCKFSKPLDN